MIPRHNVFISYHHRNDEAYKREFERLFSESYKALESQAVSEGDIDPRLPTDLIRARIRDKFIRIATVTVVLIGEETWKRRHVDWEIASSIRATKLNSRTGLLGIILPTYPRSDVSKYTKSTIPPRLWDNINCGYASIHNWTSDPEAVALWIHNAYTRRSKQLPDNSRDSFIRNKNSCGWT